MRPAFPSRIISLVLCFAVLITQTGCVAYQKVAIPSEQVFTDTTFKQNISRYRIIVSDPMYTLELKDPSSSGDNISGMPEILSPGSAQKLKGATRYGEKRDNKNCIFLTTNTILAKPDSTGRLQSFGRINLSRSSITSLEGYTVNEGESFFRSAAIAGIGILALAVTFAILSSTSDAAHGSCLFCSNSDGNHNDNNNGSSDSGSSDSGSSNSGGSSN